MTRHRCCNPRAAQLRRPSSCEMALFELRTPYLQPCACCICLQHTPRSVHSFGMSGQGCGTSLDFVRHIQPLICWQPSLHMAGNTSANEAHTLHCSQPGTIGWVLPKLNAASSGVLRCVPTHPSLILPHDCPALTPMDGSNPDVGPAVTRNSPLISTASVLGKMYTNAVTSMQRCSASEPCRQRQGGSTCGKAYIQVQDVLEWSLCAECHRPRLTA